MHSIAIFGGTFDPIHNGHILTSLAIQKSFQFSSYRFIPCKVPAIKPASTASTEQRIHMLRLALKNYNQFEIDLREIKRDTPSYMVETLKSLRKDYPYASITLILGFDAFLSFGLAYIRLACGIHSQVPPPRRRARRLRPDPCHRRSWVVRWRRYQLASEWRFWRAASGQRVHHVNYRRRDYLRCLPLLQAKIF